MRKFWVNLLTEQQEKEKLEQMNIGSIKTILLI